jgi:hypothetical protein
MSRTGPMQTAFNGGELSPSMLGRPDHDLWGISLAAMVGYAPRPQGPAEACPGFLYVETAPGPCRLIPFEPEATQGYLVEASAALLRFYTNDVLLGGANLASPYSYAQVQTLDYEQNNDVAYLYHRAVQTRELVREDADTFSLAAFDFDNGPFLERNDDESLTLSFDGVTGSVAVTASAAVFAASDVGRLIEIEAHDLSDIPSWEPGISTSAGAVLQWDGRVYQVVGGSGRTGTVAPVHTRGVEWDGMGAGTDLNGKAAGGVQLAYMHDMFGRLRITAFTDTQHVTATVTRTLPLQTASAYAIEDYVPPYFTPDGSYTGGGTWAPPPDAGTYTAGTWRWRLGAFSGTTGWPEHGAIWNERHVVALDDVIAGSVAGDLADFDRLNELGDVSVDQAFLLRLPNGEKVRWLHAGDELFIGTDKAEYVLRPASAAQPFGPGNIKLARQTKQGSAAVKPVDSDSRPIFLQRNKARLLEVTESTYGRFKTEDLTRYADHIGNSPFVELCWQREPLQLLWGVRADGVLASADYLPDEQVLGWWRRPLAAGLAAKSICSITDPDGRRAQLWCAAEYGGAWWVMRQAPWRLPGEAQDPLAVMLDGALTYDGAAEDTFILPHLPGATVEVVADGLWLGSKALDGDGTLTLGTPAQKVVAGLPYDGVLGILPLEAGGDNGPAQGKMKRVSRVILRLQGALGLQVVMYEPDGTKRVLCAIENTFPVTDLTAAIPEITRDVPADIIGQWDRAGQLAIERVAPFRSTVQALMYVAETSER